MFSNKLNKQFYFAPYDNNNNINNDNNNNWNIFEFNDIFVSNTSFLCDIFSNVIEPLVQSFKNGQSGCLALYCPDKTEWNDRLQLFDIIHQILLKLKPDRINCKISAYEINDDNAYDLLPIKSTSHLNYNTNTNNLQFSRPKLNRAPLKLAMNRSLDTILVDLNKITIKSIETGLQYFERSNNLFKSSKSSHYVFSITGCNGLNYSLHHGQELRIVQLCTSDPARNQSLLNIQECVKVLKQNKMNQSRLKKSLVVPYRRHIFTKLFQKYIDGTSLFSFLFYLPPIHHYKINKSLYLDRILSLLKYSCRSKHTSPYTPLSKQYQDFKKQIISSYSKPSSVPSTLTNSPQNQHEQINNNHNNNNNEPDTILLSMLNTNTNQSGSEDSDIDININDNDKNNEKKKYIESSLLQSTESTNLNLKTLLNRAYNELELSRQQSEKLLSHKNHTIEQLSKQVDAVRHDHEKDSISLNQKLKQQNDTTQQIIKNNKIKINEYENIISKQKQQIDTLHHEIKTMNKDTKQIKNFISEITKILQIDINNTHNLSWNDIIHKISHQQSQINQANHKIESLEDVISKVNTSYNTDIDVYKEQIDHSQQLIVGKNKEIESLRTKIEEQSKNIELLTKISSSNELKMKNVNENHEKELKELHSMLDKLSDEYNSLKSTQSNTPQNEMEDNTNDVIQALSKELQDEKSKTLHLEFQSIVHQQLSCKVQQIHNKLQNKFNAQNDKYKSEIIDLKSEIQQLQQYKHENEEKLKEYENILVLHKETKQSLKESNTKCDTLQYQHDIMKQKINELNALIDINQEDLEAITTSYKTLLEEITPIQDENKELKVEYDLISRAYQETRDDYNTFKQQSIHKTDQLTQNLITNNDKINQLQISLDETLQKLSCAQLQNKSVIKQINNFKRASRELKSQNVAIKFQCIVHRGLYASLKEELKRLKSNHQSNSEQLQEQYKKSIQDKDEKYNKLMNEYKKLEKELNSKSLIIPNESDSFFKSLQEDKENLQSENKRLKQQTNVYKFQSAAHHKLAQSAKHEKHKLKSQVIALLEQHAPSQEIKQLLKDNALNNNQNIKNQTNIYIPMDAHKLPSFEDIETPKSVDNDYQDLQNQIVNKDDIIQKLNNENKQIMNEMNKWRKKCDEYKKNESELHEKNNNLTQKIQELQDILDAMESDKENAKMKQIELQQERNKLLSKTTELKHEICEIQLVIQSATKYVYKETKCEISQIMQDYDAKLKAKDRIIEEGLIQTQNENNTLKNELKNVKNANEILQETVNQLNDQNNMITAYMNAYKEKMGQYQESQNKENESYQQEIYEKDNRMNILEKELKFKEEIIEQLKDDTIINNNNMKMEYNDLKQKHELLLKQCVSMSKLNESMQIENNQLLDEQILSDDKYQESQIQFEYLQQKYDKLCELLFHRILISVCYKYKCNELEEYKEKVQSDLTAEQLKMLQLNDEIDELTKLKEDAESNQTGLMLQSMEANDTINQLLEVNNTLKNKMFSNEIINIKQLKKKTQTDITYCNDPSHEEKISSLHRKFGLMCLNIEKAQLESVEFIQKAMCLSDDNRKLKKQNRRIMREMKYLQQELEELRSRSQSVWSLNVSCVESIQSNHTIYYDQDGNVINLNELKMMMEDNYIELNNIQSKTLKSTDNTMNEMNQRLNDCVDKINEFKLKQTINVQKEDNIKDIMLQIMDLSENVTNKMKQQFDGMLTLYSMRCDGITRNVRLIKHALESKQNEETQCKLDHQNIIEKYLYDLQFTMKILKETFKNEMMSNIKHLIKTYKNEYEQTQITISNAFKLTMEKYNESINDKNNKINELETLLFEKSDQFKNMMNKNNDKIKLNKNHYNELKSINNRLQNEVSKQNKLIQQINTEKDKMNDEINKFEIQCDEHKMENNSLKQEIDKLEDVVAANKKDKEEKESKFEELQHEISEQSKQNELIQQIVTEKDKMNEEMNDKMDKLKKEYDEHKTVTSELKMENNSLKQEIDKLEDVITANKEYKEQKESKFEELQHEISELSKQNESIQQITTEKDRTNDEISDQMNKLKKECEEHKTVTLELRKENNSLKRDINKLEHVLAANKKDKEEQILKFEELRDERNKLMIKIKELQHEICELQTKLTLFRSDQEINTMKQQEQETKLRKLMNELKVTKQERDKYYGDKQLLQQEMKLVNKQLDELNDSKTQLITQIEQLMVFQNNTVELREKMEEYTQMTACNQQRIQQLESMKTTLEKDNITQLEKMQKVFAENESFKQQNKKQTDTINEMQCIIQNQKVKVDELQKVVTNLKEEKAAFLQVSKDKERLNDEIIKNKEEEKENILKELSVLKEENDIKQEKVETLQSKFGQIIIKNANQHNEIIELKAMNDLLKQEMSCCDKQIMKLKECIINKFKDIDIKYIEKLDELKDANNMIKDLNIKKRDLQNDIQLFKIEIIEKDECIKELQITINDIGQKYGDEKATINDKLDTLSLLIKNKLNTFGHTMNNKDREINELCKLLTLRDEQIYEIKKLRSSSVVQMNNEIMTKLQLQDENEMLKQLKIRLESEIEELNSSLNASHSKHRMIKQLFDETNKTNKKLKDRTKFLEDQASNLQQQVSFAKHENEQIYRYRHHIKEKCDELQSRLIRYKEKFKSACNECTLLRKKTTALDQLLRLADNQIHQLQFDKKSSHVREKMLSDLIEKMNGENIESLYKAYNILSAKTNDCDDFDDDDTKQSMDCMKQRIEDLKSECNHYKEILILNDENNMDLKQQTALYTHQILENWQKIFDKLMSMINIKSYTVEILQKTVNDIIEINKNYKDKDYEKENKLLSNNLDEMKDKIRKLETKHRKEKIELNGLLEREMHLAHTQRDCMEKEVNVYREKLQSFYKKYHRSKEEKEQKQLQVFMDNMRHEMSQITQENVTMATITNSLREIVREQEDKSNKLEIQNESMYQDIYELCQYMQQISGETFLSEDEENMYNSSNLSEMISAVKQKALSLSISSSTSSLHQENKEKINKNDEDEDDDEDEEYAIIDHDDGNDGNDGNDDTKNCPICEQQFNQMAWRYKCTKCHQFHCSLCAPIRVNKDNDNNNNDSIKYRVCHSCFQTNQ